MRVPRLLLAVLLTIPSSLAVGCSRGAPDDIAIAESLKKVTVDELDAMLTSAKEGKLDLHVYDANEASYYASGHVPGAKWIAFNQVREADLPPNKDATIVFYCASES